MKEYPKESFKTTFLHIIAFPIALFVVGFVVAVLTLSFMAGFGLVYSVYNIIF